MMALKALVLILAFAVAGLTSPASAVSTSDSGMPVFWAHLEATVSLSRQQITIKGQTSDARQITYTWPVSTGRKGFETPTGSYRPIWADEDHKSSIYEDAPMPHAVFFVGGYAIHGTTEVKNLGKPASHGCVRLDPKHAAIFYETVNAVGLSSTKITVVD